MEGLLKELLNFLSIEFTVMLTATLPIIEVRAAIPVGKSLRFSTIHLTEPCTQLAGHIEGLI